MDWLKRPIIYLDHVELKQKTDVIIQKNDLFTAVQGIKPSVFEDYPNVVYG